ncbi:HTH-type transcriptional regulator Xre [Geomicrobium sp. JCM 19039]|nr:HTH-type transcriptional regulator Xre [Geomicrobium sp. JCM 19039]
MYGNRLSSLRKKKGLSQQELTNLLKLNRSTYSRYETEATEPDYDTLLKLAKFHDVSVDYLLGNTESTTVNVAGQEIELNKTELKVFNEIKKHPIMFHDLQSDPEKKIKELISMWEYTKKIRDEYEKELDPDDDGMEPLPDKE